MPPKRWTTDAELQWLRERVLLDYALQTKQMLPGWKKQVVPDFQQAFPPVQRVLTVDGVELLETPEEMNQRVGRVPGRVRKWIDNHADNVISPDLALTTPSATSAPASASSAPYPKPSKRTRAKSTRDLSYQDPRVKEYSALLNASNKETPLSSQERTRLMNQFVTNMMKTDAIKYTEMAMGLKGGSRQQNLSLEDLVPRQPNFMLVYDPSPLHRRRSPTIGFLTPSHQLSGWVSAAMATEGGGALSLFEYYSPQLNPVFSSVDTTVSSFSPVSNFSFKPNEFDTGPLNAFTPLSSVATPYFNDTHAEDAVGSSELISSCDPPSNANQFSSRPPGPPIDDPNTAPSSLSFSHIIPDPAFALAITPSPTPTLPLIEISTTHQDAAETRDAPSLVELPPDTSYAPIARDCNFTQAPTPIRRRLPFPQPLLTDALDFVERPPSVVYAGRPRPYDLYSITPSHGYITPNTPATETHFGPQYHNLYGSRQAQDTYSDPFNASRIHTQPTTTSYPQEPSAHTFPANMYHPADIAGGPLPYYSQPDSTSFEPPTGESLPPYTHLHGRLLIAA